ncbi:hypothetical protein F5Y17DRAFT_331836 [Xylariaceae sp. FL0594]|nr:hypothetical protein F5Y17DRAFT_331836 [Xylariaceae sp. FL0594]
MTTTPSPTSFTLFSSLPTELRLHIWVLSCEGRVVQVSYDPEQDRCTSPTSVPPILQVCRESRSEALRQLYKPAFGTKSHEPSIYFSRALDTLYIPRPPFMGYDDCTRSFADLIRDTDDVVHLAVDYVSPAIKRPWETYNKYVLMQSFRQVHKVLLVVNANADANVNSGDDDTHVSYGGGQHGHGDWSLLDPVGDDDDDDDDENGSDNDNDDCGNDDGDDKPCSQCRRIINEVKAAFFYEVGGELVVDEKGLAVLEPLHLPSLVVKVKIRKEKDLTAA